MINPLELTETVEDTYARYLSTAFYLRDDALRRMFGEKVRDERSGFAKGPYLEVTPPFEPGMSVRKLVAEGVLDGRWLDTASDSIPLDRPLYGHQEKAIRKILAGRNIVVATGTGSGKTETFLYPIFDTVFKEQRAGTLGDGVRALILYPMNALVNDQLKRLRAMLKSTEAVTFGRYIGETPELERAALTKYQQLGYPILRNERRSREVIRQKPPHILVTNYAMLEYLLQRPDDSPLFSGDAARQWRFIVVDEAHTYRGASGSEVGLLVRRLRDRVGLHRIQAVATSATLGTSETYADVTRFASGLFDEPFEWLSDVADRQDVVGPVRQARINPDTAWGSLDRHAYTTLHELYSARSTPSAGDLRTFGLPEPLVASAHAAWLESPGAGLHKILQADRRTLVTLAYLKDPQLLADALVYLRESTGLSETESLSLIHLLVAARPDPDSAPLMSARYHLFLRAMEGVYVTLGPQRTMDLRRRKEIKLNGEVVTCFELGFCQSCGSSYVVGKEDRGYFRPYSPLTSPDDDVVQQTPTYLALVEDSLQPVEDDDNFSTPTAATLQLCWRCGQLAGGPQLPLNDCERGGHHGWIMVARARTSPQGWPTCALCGRGNARGPSRFLTGQDATSAVIASSLYGAIQAFPEPAGSHGPLSKLLVFSDSRQDAAYFAPYLDATYQQLVWRRMIYQVLAAHQNSDHMWTDDLIDQLADSVRRSDATNTDTLTPTQMRNLCRIAVIRELVDSSRSSLSGMGLVRIRPVVGEEWPVPRVPHWERDDLVWPLVEALWAQFAHTGAVDLPPGVLAGHVLPYDAQAMPSVARTAGTGPAVKSWLPKAGYRNGRLDYMVRVGQAAGWPADQTEEWARSALEAVFDYWTSTEHPWNNHNIEVVSDRNGVRYQAKHRRFTFGLVGDTGIFRCDRCSRITLANVFGVCPTWRCFGILRPLDPAEMADNHYYRVYTGLTPVRMRVEEHTAQLTSEAAQALQEEFAQGKVTVLSCSTTFELGVDAGDLEAVFMRNVPPEPSNYVQRAGRAGRRTDAAAIAVTFAQRRAHDIAQFNSPLRYVSGQVHPPRIVLTNEKIARRHLHACVTAWYFHKAPTAFGPVKNFVGQGLNWAEHLDQLRDALSPVPPELKATLENVLPREVWDDLALSSDGWVPELTGPNGALKIALVELEEAVTELQQLREERSRANRPSDIFTWSINTLLDEHILQFLANHNVLPKYGFPTDVVRLHIAHQTPESKRLELTRDLALAIVDYAPGNTVVAGGHLWQSYALKRVRGREWRWIEYAICPNCRYFATSSPFQEFDLPQCPECGHGFSKKQRMIVPQFGFTTSLDVDPKPPGLSRRERIGYRRTYFTEFRSREDVLTRVFAAPGGESVKAEYSRWGRFTVMNRGEFNNEYLICSSCGYAVPVDPMAKAKRGVPPKHRTYVGQECSGKFQHAALGHQFDTDVLSIEFPAVTQRSPEVWYSLAYALLEGATQFGDIDRRDVNVTLRWGGPIGNPTVMLYDNVPGGAGHVRHVFEQIEDLWRAAAERTSGDACGCGPETSCYGCLRNYDNQPFHEVLQRGAALAFLQELLGKRR